MASKHNLRQKDVSDAMKENMTHLLNRVVTFYQGELKKKLNRSASPPVSSPGNPPHKRTGTLGRSFVTTAATRVGPIYRLSLGTNVPYANWLEYGADLPGGQPYFVLFGVPRFVSRNHRLADKLPKTKASKLAARPFFVPTFLDKELRGRVDREIAKVENRVRKSLANKIKGIA